MAMVQTLSASGTATSNGAHPATAASVLAEQPPPAAEDVKKEEQEEQLQEEEEQPVVDIVINNVVAAFCVRCHLDLKYIAMNGDNVEYRRENGMVTMKLRNPYTTASLWSSGKITCTGATSEQDARIGARRVARYLQTRLKYRVKFANYRVVNVLGTCNLPFAIRIADFSQKHPKQACYEPELHPGVTYRIEAIRATLKVFSTGSITITAASVSKVSAAVEHIFPLVHEFRKEKTSQDLHKSQRMLSRRHLAASSAGGGGNMDECSDSDVSDYGAADMDDEDREQGVSHPPPAKYRKMAR